MIVKPKYPKNVLNRKRKKKYLNILPALIARMGLAQLYLIQSQPTFTPADIPLKALKIAQQIISTQEAIAKSIKEEPKHRFRMTGRYY